MVDKTLLIWLNFYISVISPNNISILLIFKKHISKIIANLVLATKKNF